MQTNKNVPIDVVDRELQIRFQSVTGNSWSETGRALNLEMMTILAKKMQRRTHHVVNDLSSITLASLCGENSQNLLTVLDFFHMGVSPGCWSDDHKFQIQNPLLLALSFPNPKPQTQKHKPSKAHIPSSPNTHQQKNSKSSSSSFICCLSHSSGVHKIQMSVCPSVCSVLSVTPPPLQFKIQEKKSSGFLTQIGLTRN